MTEQRRPAPGLIPRPVATGIAVVITVVWAANYLAPLVVPGFERSEVVNTAFMLVAGAIFALGKGPDRRDDGDDGDDGPRPPRQSPTQPHTPTPPAPEPVEREPVPDPDAVPVADLLARLGPEYQQRRRGGPR